MKTRFIILLALISVVACKRRQQEQQVLSQKDSIQIHNKPLIDTSSTPKAYMNDTINEKQDEEVEEADSKLIRISATDYKDIDSLNKPMCGLDSNGFVKNLGVTVKSMCDEVNEICESYLVETKSGKTMPLPADFDAGLLGLKVSPQCDKFLTYSSYDMPDYDKYYAHRALVILYDVRKGVGLDAIKWKKTLGFKLWSVMEVKWLDEKSIALKLFKKESLDNTKFTYFKVRVE
jgi:hypothetical protein